MIVTVKHNLKKITFYNKFLIIPDMDRDPKRRAYFVKLLE